jgi:hypothetical protein
MSQQGAPAATPVIDLSGEGPVLRLSPAHIAGISVAAVAVVIATGVIVYIVVLNNRKRRRLLAAEYEHRRYEPPPAYAENAR